MLPHETYISFVLGCKVNWNFASGSNKKVHKEILDLLRSVMVPIMDGIP